jgi:histidinol-phosphate aminotransferase
MRTREESERRFAELGFSFEPSSSNFVFVTHPRVPAKKIFDYLREKHIFVRWFDKPRISNYLRVTIGTDAEMDRLFEALKEVIG